MSHTHTPANVVDDDKHFRINPDTRTIERTAETDPVLVQFDHNSERFTFDIPKEVDGHDMSQCNSIQVHYINVSTANVSDTKSSMYEVDDCGPSESDPEMLSLSWLIDQAGTTLVGPLYFAITFKCTSTYTDENGDEKVKLDYIWSTSPYKGVTVSDGINNNEKLGIEYYDVVDEWFNTIKNAGEIAEREAIAAIQTATEQAKNNAKSDIDKYTQQVIQNDLIPDALRISDILVQEKGQSEERIMSQKSVSQELDELEVTIKEETMSAVNDVRALKTELEQSFANANTLVKCSADSNGNVKLETGKKYRVYGTKTDGEWSVQLKLSSDSSGSTPDPNGPFGITPNPYNEFVTLCVSEITSTYIASTGTYTMTVKYIVDGNEHTYTSGMFASVTTTPSVRVVGADEVYNIVKPNGEYKVSANGIADIRKTATNGLTDTYTISFDDGSTTTFNVKNGNGITDVIRTKVGDYEDTYTIYLTNGSSTTFKVPNGGSVGVKKKVSGGIVSITDISPIEHRVKVKARSKNMIPYPYSDTTKTTNGITYTDNGDGSITANGTATGNAVFYFINAENSFYVDGTVCLSGCPEGGSFTGTGHSIRINYYENGVETSGGVDVGNGRSITLDNKQVRIYAVILAGTTVNDLVIRPQLELGSVATEYIPYAQPDGIDYYFYGKNMFKMPELATKSGVTLSKVNDYYVLNGTATAGDNFTIGYLIFPAGTYSLSANNPKNIGSDTPIVQLYSESTGARLDALNNSNNSCDTDTIPYAPDYQCRIRIIEGTTYNNFVIKPQIELGSVVTEYEEYKELKLYTSLPDGTVPNVTSIYPSMTVATELPGLIVDVEYNRDPNKEILPVNKVILTDRTTGKDYELYIDNGKIFIEEA